MAMLIVLLFFSLGLVAYSLYRGTGGQPLVQMIRQHLRERRR